MQECLFEGVKQVFVFTRFECVIADNFSKIFNCLRQDAVGLSARLYALKFASTIINFRFT